jgi:hypothetical protein
MISNAANVITEDMNVKSTGLGIICDRVRWLVVIEPDVELDLASRRHIGRRRWRCE